MSRTFPVDPGARRRLLDAQRAESKALGVAFAVARRKRALHERLDALDDELAEAESVLASISGLPRAAQLLGLDQPELARRIKRVEKPGHGAPRGRNDEGPPALPDPAL